MGAIEALPKSAPDRANSSGVSSQENLLLCFRLLLDSLTPLSLVLLETLFAASFSKGHRPLVRAGQL